MFYYIIIGYLKNCIGWGYFLTPEIRRWSVLGYFWPCEIWAYSCVITYEKCLVTICIIFPFFPTVIQKLLDIIGRVRLCPSCSFATALDSDINQTTGSAGHLSMWENRCMHAAVCLLRAGQPRSASDAAKLGQFIGQFSWVTGDPIGVKRLYYR